MGINFAEKASYKYENMSSFLGLFMYSDATEQTEKKLFEVGKKLRAQLGDNDSDSVDLEKIFVKSYMAHPFDLHGRRRCFVAMESFKVHL